MLKNITNKSGPRIEPSVSGIQYIMITNIYSLGSIQEKTLSPVYQSIMDFCYICILSISLLVDTVSKAF